jgi:hypothetical protein
MNAVLEGLGDLRLDPGAEWRHTLIAQHAAQLAEALALLEDNPHDETEEDP